MLMGIQITMINVEESILYNKVFITRVGHGTIQDYIIWSNGKFGYLGLDGKMGFDTCLFETEDDLNRDFVCSSLNDKEYT